MQSAEMFICREMDERKEEVKISLVTLLWLFHDAPVNVKPNNSQQPGI